MKISSKKKSWEEYQLEQKTPEELKQLSEKIDDRLFGQDEAPLEEAKAIVTAGDIWDEAKEVSAHYGTYQGLRTGYKQTEELMGSFMPGEMLILAGPPGKGKSLFAQNVMFNVIQTGKPVAFISLEMQPTLSLSRMQLMATTPEEEDNLKSLLWFQQKPEMTHEEIGIFMANAAEVGAALVVIDYLQFVPKSTSNERAEISSFVRHFKKMAQKYNIPVILISSINRNVEKDKMPDLVNLAETSVIEFTADMVGFIWREQGSEEMQFYLRKNRSRRLSYESVIFKQDGWRLIELKPNAEGFIDPFEDMK